MVGHVLYAGTYSLADVPGRRGPCVEVVFPLPNGNAIVLMKPVAHADGSLTVVSAGARFGDPGFYFTVAVPGRPDQVWARYLGTLKESIHVYPDGDDRSDGRAAGVRADHVLTVWGATFLRLHYRLRPRAGAAAPAR